MQIVRKVVLGSAAVFACLAAQAQTNCPITNKLAFLVPFTTTSGANCTGINSSSIFNGPIGVQISQLPVAASAPGAVILTVNGNPQAFDNLGPILLDRPDSVGRGHFVFGFSYQTFNFNHLDGIGIGSIPFAYSNPQSTTGSTQISQTNYFQQTVHVNMRYNQYVALATYGLPKKTDLSVIVPVAHISISAYNLNVTEYPVLSSNTLSLAEPLANTNAPGHASGVGDIQFNVKHVLWSGGEAGRAAISSGFVFRIPSGDALNYLGSGAYGFNLYGLASYKARISPHVKLAYQWNTNSVLLNPTGTGTDHPLPGGAQYGVGFDIGATPELTISADFLANEFINSPNIAQTSLTIPASSVGLVPSAVKPCPANLTGVIAISGSCSLSTITNTTSTYTTGNLTMGLKLKPLRHQNLILYGNVLMQVNDVGLRSDPSPSFGVSYRTK